MAKLTAAAEKARLTESRMVKALKHKNVEPIFSLVAVIDNEFLNNRCEIIIHPNQVLSIGQIGYIPGVLVSAGPVYFVEEHIGSLCIYIYDLQQDVSGKADVKIDIDMFLGRVKW